MSFISYVEIKIYNNIYRLITTSSSQSITNSSVKFTLNDVLISPPYNNPTLGINVYLAGGTLKFITKYFSISWGGKSQAEVLLNAAYSKFVCGLCGDGDGNKLNDFVDRAYQPVQLIGDRFTKHFEWGSKWRIPATDYPKNDASIDIDKTKCAALPVPCSQSNTCASSPVCTVYYSFINSKLIYFFIKYSHAVMLICMKQAIVFVVS